MTIASRLRSLHYGWVIIAVGGFVLFACLGLPLLGVYLAGHPVGRYLEFPPRAIYVQHAPFSRVAFGGYAVAIVAVLLFLVQLWRKGREKPLPGPMLPVMPFPWWGWLGLTGNLIFWVLAWTRFPWFSAWQLHTFTPLWLCFVVVVNAMTYRLKGRSLMTHETRFFLALFPVSSSFWWFFEYLNRFVQNWHYLGPEYGAWQYFWLATLPFSTVLPAVLSVREWLLCHPRFNAALERSIRIQPAHPRALAWLALVGAAAGLTGIGVYPNLFFSLLWVSPGLILLSLQVLSGKRHALSAIAHGDWSLAVSSAVAALICGWFWEMWNYYSLAKWQYSIPYVNRFHLFEMPLLGYAGYLPFGLECAVVAGLLLDFMGSGKNHEMGARGTPPGRNEA